MSRQIDRYSQLDSYIRAYTFLQDILTDMSMQPQALTKEDSKYWLKQITEAVVKYVAELDKLEDTNSEQYTGHRQLTISGESLIDHIRPGLEDECQYYKVSMPSDKQIALVIYQLRMHHVITHAEGYDQSKTGKTDERTDFYPEASSIGRYFSDAAHEVLTKEDE